MTLGEPFVLGRQRVDGRRDDADLCGIQPRRHVLAPGEDEGPAGPEVRTEDGPGLVRPPVGVSTPTWRPPHHQRPRPGEGWRHAGGLGIVEEHHVTGTHPVDEGVGVGRGDLGVVGRLGRPSSPPSPGTPWMRLWIRLVMAKKRGVALDHHPPGVDPGPDDVADQHLEHLGHAPAGGGGVDVPHRRRPEEVAGGGGGAPPGRHGVGCRSTVGGHRATAAARRPRGVRHGPDPPSHRQAPAVPIRPKPTAVATGGVGAAIGGRVPAPVGWPATARRPASGISGQTEPHAHRRFRRIRGFPFRSARPHGRGRPLPGHRPATAHRARQPEAGHRGHRRRPCVALGIAVPLVVGPRHRSDRRPHGRLPSTSSPDSVSPSGSTGCSPTAASSPAACSRSCWP